MARWKKPGKSRKAQPPRGGPIGCVLLIVIALSLITWTFFAALNPN